MASGTLSLGTNGKLMGQIVWSSYTNGASANSSTVTASLQVKKSSSSENTLGTWSYEFGVGNESAKTTWYASVGASWKTIKEITTTVSHAADGNGSCYLYGKITGPSGTTLAGKSVAATSNVALDYIPRAASILSAPNFTDRDNPTVTYENPAGSAATVQFAIFNTDGMTSYAGYRNASSTGTSYTFNLTEEERQRLRDAVPSGSNTMYVNFYIKTIINGSTVEGSIRSLTRILTVYRDATITSAPDFNDESNPTVSYNNPNGNNVDDLQICITNSDESKTLAAYRSISKTGSSYTFSLTSAERSALIAAIPKGSSNTKVKFILKTIIGTYTGSRKTTKTLSITNATPGLTWTLKDNGATSKALTQNQDVIIKGFNYVVASMTPSYKKGATKLNDTSETITNASDVRYGTSASFNNVENGTFSFSVRDSFGQLVTKSGSLTVIPYIKVSCNLDSANLSTDGNLVFKVSGNYFNDKFGTDGVNNALTLEYRIKEGTNDYSAWTEVTPSISGNKYGATVTIPGKDYRNSYTVQARAKDKVNTSGIASAERVVRSIPGFNWGDNNFDINVPLNVEEGAYISNGATISGGTTFNGGTYFNGDVAMNKNLHIDGQISASSLSEALLGKIYPVGSIYMNYTDSTNPRYIFGFGTWEQISGCFLWATKTTPGRTGGSETKTLKVENLPAHNHTASSSSSSSYGGANFYIRHGHNANTDSVKGGNNTVVTEGVGEQWGTGFTTSSYSHKLDQVHIGGTVSTSTTTTINNTGSGKAFDIVPPYLEVYVWKRTA